MGCEGSLAGATPSPAVLGGEMLPGPLDVPVRPHPAQQDPNPNSACCARGRGRGVGMGRRDWLKSNCHTAQCHPWPKQLVPFLVQWQTPGREGDPLIPWPGTPGTVPLPVEVRPP